MLKIVFIFLLKLLIHFELTFFFMQIKHIFIMIYLIIILTFVKYFFHFKIHFKFNFFLVNVNFINFSY